MVVVHNGELHRAHSVIHKTPGNLRGFVRAKMRNVRNGSLLDHRYRSEDYVERAILDEREMQYLYKDGDDYVFMDGKSYDQLTVSGTIVGDAADFMLENQDAIVATHEGAPLFVELPASVELTITYTEPGLQGDRSTGGTKPATLETGFEVQVPLFLEQGTKVKVDTRTGDYLGREK